jgi:hypothetical protein
MKSTTELSKADSYVNEKVRTSFMQSTLSTSKTSFDSSTGNMSVGNDGPFLDYLNWNGLANERNMLILSPSNHYYYDIDDLKNVTILVNQKKMNMIKQLNDFLDTVYNVLSPESNFIGCFSESKTRKGISFYSRLYKKFINFLDSKIDIDINREYMLSLLESHGFKVMDMTEIDGVTYFLTQN